MKKIEILRLTVNIVGLSVILAYISYKFSLIELYSAVGQIEFKWLIYALLLQIIGHIGSGLRHLYILNGLNCGIELYRILILAFSSTFLNQILPTGLGGDAMRLYYLKKRTSWSISTLSVFLDRFVGFIFKSANVAFLSVWLDMDYIFNQSQATNFSVNFFSLYLVLALLLIGFVISLIMFRSRSLIWQKYKESIFLIRSFFKKVNLLKLLVASAFAYFPYILSFAFFGKSMGAPAEIANYLLVVPLIFFSMQMPFSIGSWGVREAASIMLLPLIGYSDEIALMTSIFFGLGMIITSFFGFVLWHVRHYNRI